MKETYIVDLFDYYSSNGATITELETYLNAKKVSYRVLGAYDSTTKGLPYYWNNTSYWSVDKLSNGNKTYTDNPTGSSSSTLFIYNNSVSTAGQGNWARFSIETDSKIDKIIITAGSPEGRIPRLISVYRVKGTYDSSILSNRSLDNLEEIKVLTFNSTNLTPMDLVININKARLSIKSPTTDEYYSLSDNTLIYLPDNSTKNMILHGIEQGKEIQLDVPFDKKTYPITEGKTLGIGKVFEVSNGLKEKITNTFIREVK
ncbi:MULTISPECIES: hypothetical protein [unclassified Lysinibacillus]|uniref:hypothetical protein n=1 Tax=unclassified Lysinibacillus TaxID=2636778 RepID=UPI00380AACD0